MHVIAYSSWNVARTVLVSLTKNSIWKRDKTHWLPLGRVFHNLLVRTCTSFSMLLVCRLWLLYLVELLAHTEFYEQVTRLSADSSAAGKAYMVAIARIAAALEFRPSAQDEIKCMIQLLGP